MSCHVNYGCIMIPFFSQVHESTVNSSGLPHLSVSETKLVRYPELLPEYLNSVNDNILLIDTHRQWLKKCSVFWEWMVRTWWYIISSATLRGTPLSRHSHFLFLKRYGRLPSPVCLKLLRLASSFWFEIPTLLPICKMFLWVLRSIVIKISFTLSLFLWLY